MPSRLGIVAGGGDLPARIAAAARAAGRDIFVLGLDGHVDADWLDDMPHGLVPLGAAGRALQLLRRADVEEVVFAGRVDRPSLAALRPDARALRFLARIAVGSMGDDKLMRAVLAAIEEEGFRVVSPASILADALAPEGPFGRLRPDAAAADDIARGLAAAEALGRADVGQAVVVQDGIVLAVEAAEGTDAMLERAARVRRAGPGGVLVKLCKPQQERRIDLPTIGPATVRNSAAAGLRGIAVEAGATLLLDREALVAEADATGLFVTGIARPREAG